MDTQPFQEEAWGHPTSTDPVELEAARKAASATGRCYPYVGWRYGGRGRRFTRSDSGWLVWLAHQPLDDVVRQTRWLKNVLTNRGMPGVILETNLRFLARALRRAVPEHASSYDQLSHAAALLSDELSSTLPSVDASVLVDGFVAAVGTDSTMVRGAGGLLVAAIADELGGAPNSVTSLVEWLGDTDLLVGHAELRSALTPGELAVLDAAGFGDRWTAAIESTLAAAR